MTDEFSAKDPSEIVPLSFDFSNLTADVLNPVITITRESGPKGPSDLSGMLSGSPQTDGLTIRQKLQSGTLGTVYRVRCQVDTSDGMRYVLAGLIAVEMA